VHSVTEGDNEHTINYSAGARLVHQLSKQIMNVSLFGQQTGRGGEMKRVLMALVAVLALTSHAAAQEPGDAKRGAALAGSVCSQCHAVKAGKLRSPNPMAPSFENVARTPGMTDRALRVWLQSSHPTMPNFILTGDERADIVVYIMSLKNRSAM
jgi:mono/diheme cytochrome c family protein